MTRPRQIQTTTPRAPSAGSPPWLHALGYALAVERTPDAPLRSLPDAFTDALAALYRARHTDASVAAAAHVTVRVLREWVAWLDAHDPARRARVPRLAHGQRPPGESPEE